MDRDNKMLRISLLVYQIARPVTPEDSHFHRCKIVH